MGTLLHGDEFDRLLATFERTAFRLETREMYALSYERADFRRFLAGKPRRPDQIDWWESWLGQIARLTSEGKTVARVRVLAEPPSDYQRWMIWAGPWYAQAGERISYMPRSVAKDLRLPLANDWWLLDDERLIVMRFTPEGDLAYNTLVTDPVTIAPYRTWRDLAVRNATTAEKFAAA